MSDPAPVTVGIPTYARGEKVLEALEHILACDPPPAEIIVHVDQSDGSLEQTIKSRFPVVKTLSSPSRVGPGGGRHRCLLNASQPYFASFDDDSWPVDSDFFALLVCHFAACAKTACIATLIYHRHEPQPDRSDSMRPMSNYTGCGMAMRVDAYRSIPGHVDRPIPYGLEEVDVSLQFIAGGWEITEFGDLRVFHDTVLAHHTRPDIIAGVIENAALLPWLRYPVILWPYGLLQLANVVRFMVKSRRFAGIATGLVHCPLTLWKHRAQRKPLPARAVWSYLRSRPSLEKRA